MINNKLESDAFILASGMNYTPFALVKSVIEAGQYIYGDRSLNRLPFSIRFKGRGMQPFLPNLKPVVAYNFCREHFKRGREFRGFD